MSVNTSHANSGVLLNTGEYILLFSKRVSAEFSGQVNPVFNGTRSGCAYLTSQRIVFLNKKPMDIMQSFSAPIVALFDLRVVQPIFGTNYIKGRIRAQPNNNCGGEVKFKFYFRNGGATEFGHALLRAVKLIRGNFGRGIVQTGRHTSLSSLAGAGAGYETPPPAYQPPLYYYGGLPQRDTFSGRAPNMMDTPPPPYSGLTAARSNSQYLCYFPYQVYSNLRMMPIPFVFH